MSAINLKAVIAKSGALVVLLVTLLSTSAFAGRDFYEVYLNNKLIKRQYQGEATTGLMDLQLDKSNVNDKLVITYYHCSTKGAGKDRNIQIKNMRNEIVKEWKFADATGSDASMSIPVKELLALQKNNPATPLNIYYFSTSELTQGMMLASVKPMNKSVSYLDNIQKTMHAFAATVLQRMATVLVAPFYPGSI